MLYRSLIAVCLIAVTFAQDEVTTTTPKPHHTHRPHHQSNTTKEPHEHETFKYIYEPITHHMLLLTGPNCYIFTLTADERVAVHTDSGIKALELKLLNLITTGTTNSVTPDQLDKHVSHTCGRHITNFYNVV